MLLGQLIDSSGIANAVRQGKQDSINNANMLVGSGVKAYENLKAYEEKQQLHFIDHYIMYCFNALDGFHTSFI